MTQHKDNILDMATTTLANKPWVGISSTAGGGALSIMNIMTPYLEFAVILMSFLIGVITLIGLTRKYIFNYESDSKTKS